MFFYIYVLESLGDGDRYIGFTTNLPKRIKEHEKGLSFSTKPRLPMKLIYFEACVNRDDTMRREKYFKTDKGKSTLKLMLRNSLKSLSNKEYQLSLHLCQQ